MDQIKKYIYGQLAGNKLSTQEASQLLKELRELDAQKTMTSRQDIAIIGMAGRIAEAEDLEQFWQVLKSGHDCVRSLPPERLKNVTEYLQVMGLDSTDVKLREGAYLSEIDKFDPDFFKISSGEANLLDPNQRLFLETAWQAIEDAGYGGQKLADTLTGVFVGFSHDFGDSYKTLIKNYAPALLGMATIGNINSVITGRLSYLLDLKGMSLLVDTACSSSLLAIHLACQSILSGDCELAIAGGVKSWLIPAEPREGGEFGGDGGPGIGIEAKDSRTHAFDDNSTGAGFGEGVGAIVLKPLQKALADGDSIYAVIKGSAANQDGKSIGISAPNVLSQEAVIERAWKKAGVNPESISYIEAHGTGTRLGDPIEIYAMQNSFGKFTRRKHFCAVGSVKTNVGHLDNAAGIAGFLKVVLSLKNRELPPSINFERPNREINFIDSPVYINDKNQPWEADSSPRRAGISSFGLSGTNCHIILEEAPVVTTENIGDRPELNLFLLSARSESSLQRLITKYITYCTDNPTANLTDICFTANTGRGHYNYRLAIIAKDTSELRKKLVNLPADFNKINSEPSKGVFFASHTMQSQMHTTGSGIIPGDLQKITIQAGELIQHLKEINGAEYAKGLNDLAKLYTSGAEVDWSVLYKGLTLRRLHLPVYQFDRKRCWVKPTHFAEKKNDQPAKEAIYYETHWIAEKLVKKNDNLLTTTSDALTIIIKDTSGLSDKTASLLRLAGNRVIEVSIGSEFEKLATDRYMIDGSEFDYFKLFAEFTGLNISRILHFASLNHQVITNLTHLRGVENISIYSLLYIAKSLQKIKPGKVIELVLIADYVNTVTGLEELLKPENALIFGLGKVVGQELPELLCRCIDIDQNFTAEILVQELLAANSIYQVAYRQGERYIEEFTEASIKPSKDLPIREGGVYLITGGLGGLGLEIAQYLAQQAKVKLAFVSRSLLPAREEWDTIITSSEEDATLSKRLQILKTIEGLGAELRFYPADVADLAQMTKTIADVCGSYGQINGIIHAAGVAGDGLIITRDSELTKKVLSPKVAGTWILHHLTQKEKLDFFVMFSSVSAIFGGPGQGDYTAANLYLDAFAAYLNKQGKTALSINWTAWKDTGMAVQYGVNMDNLIFKPLATKEAVNHFAEALRANTAKVLIGEINYSRFAALLDKMPIKLSRDLNTIVVAKSGKMAKTTLTTEIHLKESTDNVEKKLAQIWAQILDLNEVSVNDNFYDLGGDSIIALTLINEIKKEYPGTIDVTDLFSRPTIRGLADLIKRKLHVEEVALIKTEQNETDLMVILDQLEKGELSYEEGVKLINSLEQKNN